MPVGRRFQAISRLTGVKAYIDKIFHNTRG
jgi:hypothetical protein